MTSGTLEVVGKAEDDEELVSSIEEVARDGTGDEGDVDVNVEEEDVSVVAAELELLSTWLLEDAVGEGADVNAEVLDVSPRALLVETALLLPPSSLGVKDL
jgi:hypothetical protein